MTDDDTTPSSPEQRADELRSLAGPVSGRDGTTGAPADDSGSTPVTPEDAPPPTDSPDALHDEDVDDVRHDEQGDENVPGAVEDPYELRSMPVEPNPSDDDPGSYLNT